MNQVNNDNVHQSIEVVSINKNIHSFIECGEGKGGKPPCEHVFHFLKQ